jgi:VWFA-related protein
MTLTPPQSPSTPPAYICATELTPPPDIAHQPGYRQVSISIDMTKGEPPALSRNDIRIVQGAKEIPVQYFERQPSSVGILVDSSGSMDQKLQAASAASADFIRALNPQDEIFLFAFSSKPYLLQPLTSNHYLVLARLSLLHAYGQTALYDTLWDGMLMARHGCNPRKALFVITDGMDDVSRTTLAEIDAEAQKTNVAIYSIGIGNPAAKPPSSQIFNFSRVGENYVDAKTLKTLSDASQAKTYLVPPNGAERQIRADAIELAHQIDNRYFIGFVAADLTHNPVRIELRNHKNPSLKIENAPAGVTS